MARVPNLDLATPLSEVGERRLIDEVLRPRYAANSDNFGDDCVSVGGFGRGTEAVVATIDPCPLPAARALGFTDPYYHGWLATTITLSDLAAAGARPVALLSSLILPLDLTVGKFIRLLDGLDDCARRDGTYFVGGNLREGRTVEMTTVGLGSTDGGHPLSRRGCTPGDRLLAVGALGVFWAEFLKYRRHREGNPDAVLRPVAQIGAGQVLRASGIVRSCIDNSDGLIASARALASLNDVAVELDLDEVEWAPIVREVADQEDIDPLRLGLGWGDWSLVCCCGARDYSTLRALLDEREIWSAPVGVVRTGSGVTLKHRDQVASVTNAIDSERLVSQSFFVQGIEAYVDRLLNHQLWV